MFLSRLRLDPRNRLVRRDLADCQELHRTLLSVWPQFDRTAGARAACGLLFRVELDHRTGAITLFVQSNDAPDWSRLPPGYLCEHAEKPLDAAYASLREGMRLRFRLRANPTRRVARPREGEPERQGAGKRVDIRGPEQQIAWLQRKGLEQCGFRLSRVLVDRDVPNVRTGPIDRVSGRLHDREPEGFAGEADDAGANKLTGVRRDRRLTFGSVLFEGELEITNLESFRQALAGGIGSGKAYGFGLLSVAPARA